MQFVHYKDFPPVNLAKVGTMGKENQQVTPEAKIYAIGFYEFERKVGYWVFQSQQERDTVYDTIKKQFSKEMSSEKESQNSSKQPAFLKG